jgi:hypothetical protein
MKAAGVTQTPARCYRGGQGETGQETRTMQTYEKSRSTAQFKKRIHLPLKPDEKTGKKRMMDFSLKYFA